MPPMHTLPTPFTVNFTRWLLACLSSGAVPAALAQADAPQALARCAAVVAPADRLACYDALAGRAPAVDAAPQVRLEAVGSVPTAAGSSPADASFLSRFWELEPRDKRGIFNFVGYQGNYVLPIHLTSRINRAPQSPTQAAEPQPAYRTEEAKFQLSLRTKLVQNFGFEGADVWAAFTQQAMWQIYNGTDSKPFRNTDYQPELIYVVPTAPGLRRLPFDWQWRHTQLGLAHQSNGQSDPLSRSWNRVYIGGGFERSPWVLTARVNKRVNEPISTDNNPDLVPFRGRGEFQLGWAGGLQTASLQYRSTLKDVKYGSLQLEWTTPVYNDQPNGLRWFVQAFRGYGETLTDYNFRQNSIGAGVTFLQF